MNISIGLVVFKNYNLALKNIQNLINVAIRTKETHGEVNLNLVIHIGSYYLKEGREVFLEDLRKLMNISVFSEVYITVSEVLNEGFPVSLNKIFHKAFIDRTLSPTNTDYVFVVGQDVFPNINYINDFISIVKKLNPDWVGGTEYKPKFDNPRKVFNNKEIDELINKVNTDFSDEDLDVKSLNDYKIVGDSFNANFFSRRLFEVIGYIDWNFYPNGYFSDNDFARRAQLSGLRMYNMSSRYLHLWSRTIYNVEVNGESLKNVNDFYFPMCERYYISKWGGKPGEETLLSPETVDRYAGGLRINYPNNYQRVRLLASLNPKVNMGYLV